MMDKKYLIPILIFASTLILLSTVSAAENDTVTSSTDTGIITSTTSTYKTLYEEINNASENSELILTKDYTYDSDNDYPALKHQNYIPINKTITINGNGHTINGSAEGIGFVVEAGVKNVIIKNIKFVDCQNNKNKHRIIDINGDTILDNCTFRKCVGYDTTPGIIKITGDNNIITNCKFVDCLNAMIYPVLVASESLDGGVIYLNGEYNKIINCTFTGYWTNYQFSRSNSYKIRGNCIYVGMGNNIIENCNFNHNFIIKQGQTNIVKYGDIYVHTGENNITGCSFYYSDSSVFATFIYSNKSTVHINECKFKECGSTGLYIGGDNSTLFNSEFISCSGYATKWIGANGIMKGCTFTKCTYNQINYWAGENGQFITSDNPPETETNNTQNKTGNETVPDNTGNSSSMVTPSTQSNPVTTTNIIVKKITPKITAKKKTYKAKTRTKKYTVKLTAKNKPIKKATLTLKLNGKTYKAKTNNKGIATFKLKISKKGKHTGTISFKSTKEYNNQKIKTSITIK